MLIRKLIQNARDESGATLVMVAAGSVALISMLALAVDYGMLTTARTEAQRAADAAALAGAGILVLLPDAAAEAEEEAVEFAQQNPVRGVAVTPADPDVVVNTSDATVAVWIRRTAATGNPVPTFFARIFGIDAVNIVAYGKAQAAIPGNNFGVTCLLPLALSDRWKEVNDDDDGDGWPELEDTFDPDEGDWYDPEATGYDGAKIGTVVELKKNGTGPGEVNPSWWFPWAPNTEDPDQYFEDNGPGGDNYKDRFTECLGGTFNIGTVVITEPGKMVGPTKTGFGNLYDLDPTAYWDPNLNEGRGCPSRDGIECVFDSPRVRAMPMFDPTLPPLNGRKEFTISNFGGVFVDCPNANNCAQGGYYVGRWMGITVASNDGGAGQDADNEQTGPAPIVRDPRLIE